mmetsp:Transcript_18784/g.37917  ORF Transcript_18784/g.37917 Transcript_18784/m.37917 type:complete len:135 (+) Transcript_18784:5720-6124(+)
MAEQKQRMLLAKALWSGRWKEKQSPASGECGTFTQSPITGPWLQLPSDRLLIFVLSWRRAASSNANFASGRFLTPFSQAMSHDCETIAPVASTIRSIEDASNCEADTCKVDLCSASNPIESRVLELLDSKSPSR